jgi:hypothetical protein
LVCTLLLHHDVAILVVAERRPVMHVDVMIKIVVLVVERGDKTGSMSKGILGIAGRAVVVYTMIHNDIFDGDGCIFETIISSRVILVGEDTIRTVLSYNQMLPTMVNVVVVVS